MTPFFLARFANSNSQFASNIRQQIVVADSLGFQDWTNNYFLCPKQISQHCGPFSPPVTRRKLIVPSHQHIPITHYTQRDCSSTARQWDAASIMSQLLGAVYLHHWNVLKRVCVCRINISYCLSLKHQKSSIKPLHGWKILKPLFICGKVNGHRLAETSGSPFKVTFRLRKASCWVDNPPGSDIKCQHTDFAFKSTFTSMESCPFESQIKQSDHFSTPGLLLRQLLVGRSNFHLKVG